MKTQIETVMRETEKGTPALTIAAKRGSHLYAAGEPISHYGRYREIYGVDDGLGAKE